MKGRGCGCQVALVDVAAVLVGSRRHVEALAVELRLKVASDWAGRPAVSTVDAARLRTEWPAWSQRREAAALAARDERARKALGPLVETPVEVPAGLRYVGPRAYNTPE